MAEVPHVLIVGGGFGGIAVARGLRRQPVRITVVDRTNHHLFQPLLYQVATAALAPSDIAEPIRSILRRQENAAVRLAEVTDIDLAGKRARVVDDGSDTWVAWDHLVLSAGVSHSYFGQSQWAKHAPGLKTLGDALEMRRRILWAFERAEWATDDDEREALTTFVVVGGGPTGVELAGSLAEIAFFSLRRDFRNVDTSKAKVVLVEASPHLLTGFKEHLRARAKEQLESLGVEVRLGAKVTDVDPLGVTLASISGGDATRLPSRTVLWAAGIEAAPVGATLGVAVDLAGRVIVEPDCSVPGHPDAFVIGDLAHIKDPDGNPLAGVAQVAMQSGAHVAKMLASDRAGKPRAPFVYNDKGSLATIGRSRAVGDLGFFTTSGWLAWSIWAFIHVLFLITFRNKIIVMTKWAWAWFTYERAVRLIWRADSGRTGSAA